MRLQAAGLGLGSEADCKGAARVQVTEAVKGSQASSGGGGEQLQGTRAAPQLGDGLVVLGKESRAVEKLTGARALGWVHGK